MFKYESGSFYSGSRLTAEVRLEIYDPHGAKIGGLRGRTIYNKHDRKIGTIRGDGIYDEHLNRIGSMKELKRTISCEGDPTLAALWLLLVK